MSEKKNLSLEELEKVSGGFDEELYQEYKSKTTREITAEEAKENIGKHVFLEVNVSDELIEKTNNNQVWVYGILNNVYERATECYTETFVNVTAEATSNETYNGTSDISLMHFRIRI